ncbi:MAG: hypothetical protein KIT31_04275 [Deltaproteobacteria bacterium]|nr:hypothetical protein [Deltaproteobacteria bacterium]
MRPLGLLRLFCLLCLIAAGCSDGPDSYGDDPADLQLPPRGTADFLAWVEEGHYLAWSCEAEAHPPRPRSGHGRNRICSNDALAAAATGEGPYPVGAAAVKEVLDDAGGIRLYAVYRKVEAGDGGDSWYWFEGSRDRVVANGEGDGTCTGCHASAPRDFVFTVVPAS